MRRGRGAINLGRCCCSRLLPKRPIPAGITEITSCIHLGLVNFEAWNIHPEQRFEPSRERDLPEDAYIGNVELELTPGEARGLAAALLTAADQADRPGEPQGDLRRLTGRCIGPAGRSDARRPRGRR